ncbi:uncharacterized protein LOC107264949 [Cephus cinctus]|uniref:Uncharacterized protein LOC107264949 n=1 Tax=Cephus cinctus TaxID=211228 RepID=A0AAJ7BLT2_CEPCN|nr:uncharacterized protein LOC107264949 [Cephus cinctus]
MALSIFIRPLSVILGISGLIQGLILGAVATLALLTHLCIITVESNNSEIHFFPLMVGIYFQGDDCHVYNTTTVHEILPNIIRPGWLFYWFICYIVISLLWVVFSIVIMCGPIYKKKKLHYFLVPWIILTLGICSVDSALTLYFGYDFADYQSILLSDDAVNLPTLLPIVMVTMAILASKGLVLWLLNLLSVIIAFCITWNYVVHKEDNRPLFLEQAGYLDSSPIDAFSSGIFEVRKDIHLSDAAYARFSDLDAWPRIDFRSFEVEDKYTA